MAKISTFMIGLILMSLVVTLYATFLSGLNEGYATPNYNNASTSLNSYDFLTDIKNETEIIKGEVSDIQEDANALDVIGSFFTNGYQALKLTYKSFNIFDRMTNEAIQDADLGTVGDNLKIAITSIIIILIFIAVGVSAILKKDV